MFKGVEFSELTKLVEVMLDSLHTLRVELKYNIDKDLLYMGAALHGAMKWEIENKDSVGVLGEGMTPHDSFRRFNKDPRELFVEIYEALPDEDFLHATKSRVKQILEEDARLDAEGVRDLVVRNRQLKAAGKVGLPERDFTNGADRNGRAAYPEGAQVSVVVLVVVPQVSRLPKLARYSYGLNVWFVDGMAGDVSADRVREWWPIPEEGTGFKQSKEKQSV